MNISEGFLELHCNKYGELHFHYFYIVGILQKELEFCFLLPNSLRNGCVKSVEQEETEVSPFLPPMAEVHVGTDTGKIQHSPLQEVTFSADSLVALVQTYPYLAS
ncbi:hypothetical protein Y1Q_0022985 [Alligator mississippiensis]|uniref:Uncharacterized protein n=1 Tax=Alligator mississippiensis TaxID=8496 RepID=A0A151P7B1_ALLMI|nr:hypothetical protein Y1Q_0022985 [Alligator mississippiensis]